MSVALTNLNIFLINKTINISIYKIKVTFDCIIFFKKMWLELLWKFFVFIKIITFFQFRNVYLLYQKNDGNFMSLIPLACLRLQFDFRVIFKKSLDCAVQYEVIISFATTICFQFVSLKEIFQNAKSDELFFLFQWYKRFFLYSHTKFSH